VFFADFKRVSPGCLGDPCGCPRHYYTYELVHTLIIITLSKANNFFIAF
jgi:hypothetical protein